MGAAELERRSARSGVIQVSTQAVQVLAFLLTAMIMARLLTPADFGLFALAQTVLAVVGTVRDFGFPMATVFHSHLNHAKLNALFWLTARLSGALLIFILLTAPLLSWFYGEGRLTGIACVLAVGTFAIGLSVQHEALLIRGMRFRTLRTVELAAIFIGLASGIAVAWLGGGYWALVCHLLVSDVLRAAGIWMVCSWRPTRRARSSEAADISELTHYAGYFTAYQIVMKVVLHMDRVLVGYLNGASAAGLYYNAQRWATYPIMQLFPPLTSVAVAGLSRMRDDAAAFRVAWRKGILPILSLVLPVFSFFAVEPRSTVLVVMGPQWEGAVPIFQLLAIASIAVAAERLSKWLYLSEGNTRRLFIWGVIHAPVVIVAVVIGVHLGGPVGAAAGFTVATWVLLVPGVAFCIASSRILWSDVGAVVWRPAVASALAAIGTVAGMRFYEDLPLVAHFMTGAALFGAVYVLAWIGLPGGREAAADAVRLLSTAGASALKPDSKDG
jgi:PST family polysaccharide transporter